MNRLIKTICVILYVINLILDLEKCVKLLSTNCIAQYIIKKM